MSLKGIHCLTAFCGQLGIYSIQADGDIHKRLSDVNFPRVVPVTFYFSPGERISQICLMTEGKGDMLLLGPCLAVSVLS